MVRFMLRGLTIGSMPNLALAVLLYLPFGMGCGCDKTPDFVFQKEIKHQNIIQISQDESSSGYTIRTTTLLTTDPGTDTYLHKSGTDQLEVLKDIPAGSIELPYATVMVYEDKKNKGAMKYKTQLHVKTNAKLPGEEGAPATVVFMEWPKPKDVAAINPGAATEPKPPGRAGK